MIEITLDEKNVLVICAAMRRYEASIKNGLEPQPELEMTNQQVRDRLPEIRQCLMQGRHL